ncbi:MAG: helix-hairpin-helix domain-containing protein [Pseudomonadota bacterium]
MHPSKVDRSRLSRLTDLPNVGKAGGADLRLLGIEVPAQLIGRCPRQMYEQLCATTGQRHDLCVLDVFMSLTCFMACEAPRPWWDYTGQRKLLLAKG